ncbi:MAG: DNA polymerase III subunit beta [Cohaesibacteraceae bacterium]|nr:DNA polymerase III subunit beta [Cohaesibacteraceae bacterium]MBL4876149.1 DNA polymerase III subunit beta [Cohaesibacteraceae bacterium]
MKVTLERANLLKSLNHVHRVVERRNTIPILSNVLVRAEGEGLMFKATDLDIEVLESAPAMIQTAGGTTIPALMLYEIVRKLRDGSEITLETNPDQTSLVLTSGTSTFNLQVLPESDFPDITAGEFSHKFTMKAADLKKLFERAQFAISTEETRYYLNGIYLHTVEVEGKLILRAVATDGHRLAQLDMSAPSGSEGMPGIIVPRKAVSEIQKLIEDPEADIEIEVSDTKIRLNIGTVVLTSKLIDGTFPDYQRVIPQGNDKELRVDCTEFAQAVDRVSTVSSDRGRAVKLAVSEGLLVLSVSSPDSGSAVEELPVSYNAEPLEIGFNAKYLLDITNQLKSDDVIFKLAEGQAPAVIEDSADETALYVLMPMRV